MALFCEREQDYSYTQELNDEYSSRIVLGPARNHVKFSELIRLLESNGFKLVKEKGSIRYYRRPGHDRLIRVDYHGTKEIPTGTCNAILKAAGIRQI